MISNLFILLIIIIVSFFPIVIWAYIFSYIDNSKLSKMRLFSGVFAGAVSVGPIIYMEEILKFFHIQSINIFGLIESLSSFSSFTIFSFSLLFFLLLFLLISFLTQFLFGGISQSYKRYLYPILLSLGVIAGIVILFSLMNFIPFLSTDIGDATSIDGVVLNSLKLVVFYYIITAFLEEGSKYFQFLGGSSLRPTSIRVGVLYAIFVALGFAFIENILYVYFMYNQVGFSGELLKLYFFRGVFSIILHILCTSVFAYGSLRAFRLPSFGIKTFVLGFLISIFLHSFFDIALTLGFPLIMIIYFIGGYLYVSSLFYSEEA